MNISGLNPILDKSESKEIYIKPFEENSEISVQPKLATSGFFNINLLETKDIL